MGKYFVIFINALSKYTNVYLQKSKDEVFETFKEYKAEVNTK